MTRRLLPIALAALVLAPAGIAAQAPGDATGKANDCPVTFSCVEYGDGHVIELDRSGGAIIGIVVSLSETTTTTLDGAETERSGTAAWFVRDGTGYVLAADGVPLTDRQAEADGIAIGDALVGVLAEAH